MQIISKKILVLALMFPMVTSAIEKLNKPLDAALINQERIAYWLEKRGEITSEDTSVQKQDKVNQFIKRFQENNKRNLYLPKNYQRRDIENGYQTSKGLKKQLAEKVVNTQVNVLAILIDFSDLPYNNNRLTSQDTDLYYPQYPTAHYTNLLFSDSGFMGPNGENLISAKQYYQQESGNTFNFTGSVFGWYRAKNTSDFYGANGSDGNDQNAEGLVVEAIEAAVASGTLELNDYDKKDPRDLDNDGNFNEPDGEIDHVLIIHSSIGEEAGGGVLGSNAIWSHRYSITDSKSAIEGSAVKVKHYTIQPIDSGAGVVVHEFGHDLGLDDEYDLKSTIIGAPVGAWSVMASGSWLGEVKGSQPTVFSPLAREKLQQSFGGNWINQQVIKASDITKSALDVAITQASNHDAVNQVKIVLPPRQEFFGQPQQGSYQLFSGHKNETYFQYAKTVIVPDVDEVTLSLWAKWDIEDGYDYAKISVDAQSLSNEFTTASSPDIAGVTNFITGKLAGTPWTKLTFDVSAYRNKTVTLSIDYITDSAKGGFGLSIDNIVLVYNSQSHVIDNFEQVEVQPDFAGKVNFNRITAYQDEAPDYYYLQLRSQSKLDIGLKSENYEPGVVLWYGNESYTDNNSSEHAGFGFISVVDADQSLIKPGDTQKQIRDASFSIYPQTAIAGDDHLNETSEFNDSSDYSSKEQPQSGTKLPLWGINLLVTEQAPDNNTATISLSRTDVVLGSEIVETKNGFDVSFMHKTTSSYPLVTFLWDFGDGDTSALAQPSHTYKKGGDYSVSLKITDMSGAQVDTIKKVTIGATLGLTATNLVNGFDVTLSSNTTGGVTPYTYLWDFGDDATSSLSALTHSYSKVGNYTVTLSVTDAIGQQKKIDLDLTIESTISVDFSHTITNQVVSFVGNVTNPIGNTTIKWDFGDNGTSTELSPTHNYAAVGNYVVKIAVSDDSGTTKTLSKNITISPMLKATSDSKSGGAFGMFLFVMLVLMRVRKLHESR